MTAAQRRTVTVKIGGDAHSVEVTADVPEPADLIKLATEAYHETHHHRGAGMGFAPQHMERARDRQPAGSPWQTNPTASGGDTHDPT